MGINHLNNSCQILAFVLLYPSIEAFGIISSIPQLDVLIGLRDPAMKQGIYQQLLGQNRQVMKNMAMNESYPFLVLRVYHIHCIV